MIKFEEVTLAEFTRLEKQFFTGTYNFNIRDSVFDLEKHYDIFEASKSDPEVLTFKEGQRIGTAKQLEIENKLYAKWMFEREAEALKDGEMREKLLAEAEQSVKIESPINANVCKVLVEPGDVLEKGQVVLILEAMKMEISVTAPDDAVRGIVQGIAAKAGNIVRPGDLLAMVKMA